MRPERGGLAPSTDVDARVLVIRGRQVILDTSLAQVYGVPTKALNQAVRRNIGRFPDDFRFQVTRSELAEVVTNCDHLSRLRFSAVPPWAFTEHGAIMAASVLNSPRAIEMSFVRRQREKCAECWGCGGAGLLPRLLLDGLVAITGELSGVGTGKEADRKGPGTANDARSL